MKYVDEYRDGTLAHELIEEIGRTVTRRWTIMEICGGQTHTIVKFGLDQLLPSHVELVHGPGCPVCVTSVALLDRAHAIATRPEVIFCSFGDMLRVPGSEGDLLRRKAQGADIRLVYSPLDAVELAAANPTREVVFFAVGFETTSPANAMAVWQARQRKLKNFSLLAAQVLVPPVMQALLESPDNRVQGFLGPGHVCTVVGIDPYRSLSQRFRVPIVVTGFEPIDMLEGILRVVRQLEQGRADVEIQYGRAVRAQGNPRSQRLVEQVYEICDRQWRGIGEVAASGYRLRSEFLEFDADLRFPASPLAILESTTCISGEILRGLKKPHQCHAFGRECTPLAPLGATMVSSEGACAAYFAYGRQRDDQGCVEDGHRVAPLH